MEKAPGHLRTLSSTRHKNSIATQITKHRISHPMNNTWEYQSSTCSLNWVPKDSNTNEYYEVNMGYTVYINTRMESDNHKQHYFAVHVFIPSHAAHVHINAK